MTPEAKVKAKVRKVLDELGAYYFFPATHGYGRSGILDVVGCYRGGFFGIECKAGKGKTTALQERELRRIKESGGLALVINEENVEDLKRIIEEWKDERQRTVRTRC